MNYVLYPDRYLGCAPCLPHCHVPDEDITIPEDRWMDGDESEMSVSIKLLRSFKSSFALKLDFYLNKTENTGRIFFFNAALLLLII